MRDAASSSAPTARCTTLCSGLSMNSPSSLSPCVAAKSVVLVTAKPTSPTARYTAPRPAARIRLLVQLGVVGVVIRFSSWVGDGRAGTTNELQGGEGHDRFGSDREQSERFGPLPDVVSELWERDKPSGGVHGNPRRAQ